MKRRAILAGVFAVVASGANAALRPSDFIEPKMRILNLNSGQPRVALTLDACDGGVDQRILGGLIAEGIAATVFVTGKWLARNAEAFKVLLMHPDLFEIGNHGARHHAAIDQVATVWGVRAAGSVAAIAAEVNDGAAMLEAAGAPRPHWYRGAAALYTLNAISEVQGMGWRIAAFSLNGDQGASLGAAGTAARIARSTDGEVIIAHLNQPARSSGAGVIAGVKALKERGFGFVTLSDRSLVISQAA